MDDKDQKRICNTLTIIRSLVVDPSIASQFLDCTLMCGDTNGIAFIVYMMLPLIENTHKSFDSIRKLCLTVVLEISMTNYDNSVGLGKRRSFLVQTDSYRTIYLYPLSELFQDCGETWADGRLFLFNSHTQLILMIINNVLYDIHALNIISHNTALQKQSMLAFTIPLPRSVISSCGGHDWLRLQRRWWGNARAVQVVGRNYGHSPHELSPVSLLKKRNSF